MSDSELIRRIKTALKQSGISQRELALKLGKKETEISRWMSGRMGISAQNLQRIEEVLGRPLSQESIQRSGISPIRIGIVGTGSIASRFATEAAHVAGAYISVAYNPDITQLKLFCCKYGIATEAGNFEQLLECCDAVYIASPVSTHFDYARMALEHNRHVLCEMPFTQTKSEAAELFKLAGKRGLTLIPALKTAYCPSFLKLVEIAKSGEIGDIADISGTVTTMLSANENTDFNNERLLENAAYPILAAFKLFGCDYKDVHSFTQYNQDEFDRKALFNHTILAYDNKVASIKVGTGVKSEGSLVISGTKGYIYVPAPWWKTDYFEVRFENTTNNRKFYFPYEQAGLRYEIQALLDSIRGRLSTDGLSTEETLKMIEIQNKII